MAFYDSGAGYDTLAHYDEAVAQAPRRTMAKSKLNLRDRSDADLIQFTQQHITAMTGNANFATPNPAAAAFATLLANFEAAVQSAEATRQSALQATTDKEGKRLLLESGLTQRSDYVNTISGGEETKILSSGLPVRDLPAPIGELPAPADFLATMGDQPGDIDLIWTPVRGAKTYIVQHSPYATPRVWEQVGIVTKSKFTCEDCTSGQVFVFRVAAVGAAGQSPWSDESVKMAP